jgi:tetratricopeptide (TPR) repeat protein
MNPAYRRMILEGDLTPVGELSGAFLRPKSPLHVQFAYYESGLVIEYIVDRYGFDALHAVLLDLGSGVFINDALDRHVAALPELEAGFAEFATQLAREFGPDVDWSTPELDALEGPPDQRLRDYLRDHPHNYAALELYAQLLLQRASLAEAEPILRKLLQLQPSATGSRSPAMLLADVLRQTGREDEERQLLSAIIRNDDAAPAACLRLLELETARADWNAVAAVARRLRAIDPLTPHPHRALAAAAEHLHQPREAVAALRSLSAVDTSDPADVHFRLARALQQTGDLASARRQVLMALEEAPRYRAAQELLLDIVAASETPAATDAPASTPSPTLPP